MSTGHTFLESVSKEARKKKEITMSMQEMEQNTADFLSISEQAESLYQIGHYQVPGVKRGLTSIGSFADEVKQDTAFREALKKGLISSPVSAQRMREEAEFREKEASYQKKERDQEKAAIARNQTFPDVSTIDLNFKLSDIEKALAKQVDPDDSLGQATQEYMTEYQTVIKDLLKTLASKGKLFGNYKKHIALAREKYDFYTTQRNRIIGRKQAKRMMENPEFRQIETDQKLSQSMIFRLSQTLDKEKTANPANAAVLKQAIGLVKEKEDAEEKVLVRKRLTPQSSLAVMEKKRSLFYTRFAERVKRTKKELEKAQEDLDAATKQNDQAKVAAAQAAVTTARSAYASANRALTNAKTDLAPVLQQAKGQYDREVADATDDVTSVRTQLSSLIMGYPDPGISSMLQQPAADPDFDLTKEMQQDPVMLQKLDSLDPAAKKKLQKAMVDYQQYASKAFELRTRIESLSRIHALEKAEKIDAALQSEERYHAAVTSLAHRSGKNSLYQTGTSPEEVQEEQIDMAYDDAPILEYLESLKAELSALEYHADSSLLGVRTLLDQKTASKDVGLLAPQAGFLKKHYDITLPGFEPEKTISMQRFAGRVGCSCTSSNLFDANSDWFEQQFKPNLPHEWRRGYWIQRRFEEHVLTMDTTDLEAPFKKKVPLDIRITMLVDASQMTVFTRPLPKLQETGAGQKLVLSRGRYEGKSAEEVTDDYSAIIKDWSMVTRYLSSPAPRKAAFQRLYPRIREAFDDLEQFIHDPSTAEIFTDKSHTQIFEHTAGMPSFERKAEMLRRMLSSICMMSTDLIDHLEKTDPQYAGLSESLNSQLARVEEYLDFVTKRKTMMDIGYCSTLEKWSQRTDTVQGLQTSSASVYRTGSEEMRSPSSAIKPADPPVESLREARLDGLRKAVSSRDKRWKKKYEATLGKQKGAEDSIAELIRIQKKTQIPSGPPASWYITHGLKDLDDYDDLSSHVDQWRKELYEGLLKASMQESVTRLLKLGGADTSDEAFLDSIEQRLTAQGNVVLGEEELAAMQDVSEQLKAVKAELPDQAGPMEKIEDLLMLSEQLRFEQVKELLTFSGAKEVGFDEMREGERLLRLEKIPLLDRSIPDKEIPFLIGTVLREEIEKLRQNTLDKLADMIKYGAGSADKEILAEELKTRFHRTILTEQELEELEDAVKKKMRETGTNKLSDAQELTSDSAELIFSVLRDKRASLQSKLRSADGSKEPTPEEVLQAEQLLQTRLGKLQLTQASPEARALVMARRLSSLMQGGTDSVFFELLRNFRPPIQMEEPGPDDLELLEESLQEEAAGVLSKDGVLSEDDLNAIWDAEVSTYSEEERSAFGLTSGKDRKTKEEADDEALSEEEMKAVWDSEVSKLPEEERAVIGQFSEEDHKTKEDADDEEERVEEDEEERIERERQAKWDAEVAKLSKDDRHFLTQFYHEDRIMTRKEQEDALRKVFLVQTNHAVLTADIKDYDEELSMIRKILDLDEKIQALGTVSSADEIRQMTDPKKTEEQKKLEEYGRLSASQNDLLEELKDLERDLYEQLQSSENLRKIMLGMQNNITKKREDMQREADALFAKATQKSEALLRYAKDPSSPVKKEPEKKTGQKGAVSFSGVDGEVHRENEDGPMEEFLTSSTDKTEIAEQRIAAKVQEARRRREADEKRIKAQKNLGDDTSQETIVSQMQRLKIGNPSQLLHYSAKEKLFALEMIRSWAEGKKLALPKSLSEVQELLEELKKEAEPAESTEKVRASLNWLRDFYLMYDDEKEAGRAVYEWTKALREADISGCGLIRPKEKAAAMEAELKKDTPWTGIALERLSSPPVLSERNQGNRKQERADFRAQKIQILKKLEDVLGSGNATALRLLDPVTKETETHIITGVDQDGMITMQKQDETVSVPLDAILKRKDHKYTVELVRFVQKEEAEKPAPDAGGK